MSTNTSIQIPEKMYVAFQRAMHDGHVHQGYMTSYGTDAASKKRMANLRHSTGADKDNGLEPVVLENKPMYGFKISRALRSNGWRSEIQTVSIEDPRGFQFDVTVANLIMLTDNNLIHNGEIIQQCIWARDGQSNLLLPVNCQPYQDALVNTDRVSKRVNTRAVRPGFEVLLHDGRKGMYMGQMFAITRAHYNNLEISNKKRHIVRVTEGNNVCYYGYPAMKISEVLTDVEHTKVDIINMVNNDVASTEYRTTFNKVSTGYRTVLTLIYGDEIKMQSHALTEITEADANVLVDEAVRQGRTRPAIFAEHDGIMYAVTLNSLTGHTSRNYYNPGMSTDEVSGQVVNRDVLEKHHRVEIIIEYTQRHSYYSRNVVYKNIPIADSKFYTMTSVLVDPVTKVEMEVVVQA